MREGVCCRSIKRTDYWVNLQFISLPYFLFLYQDEFVV
jgi:hypothetical protein